MAAGSILEVSILGCSGSGRVGYIGITDSYSCGGSGRVGGRGISEVLVVVVEAVADSMGGV